MAKTIERTKTVEWTKGELLECPKCGHKMQEWFLIPPSLYEVSGGSMNMSGMAICRCQRHAFPIPAPYVGGSADLWDEEAESPKPVTVVHAFL